MAEAWVGLSASGQALTVSQIGRLPADIGRESTVLANYAAEYGDPSAKLREL
jgi:hypothetical protein